jgi:hypothetical protein
MKQIITIGLLVASLASGVTFEQFQEMEPKEIITKYVLAGQLIDVVGFVGEVNGEKKVVIGQFISSKPPRLLTYAFIKDGEVYTTKYENEVWMPQKLEGKTAEQIKKMLKDFKKSALAREIRAKGMI